MYRKKTSSTDKKRFLITSPYLSPTFRGLELAPAFLLEPVAVASKGRSLHHSE
jgi:hypothetical protein